MDEAKIHDEIASSSFKPSFEVRMMMQFAARTHLQPDHSLEKKIKTGHEKYGKETKKAKIHLKLGVYFYKKGIFELAFNQFTLAAKHAPWDSSDYALAQAYVGLCLLNWGDAYGGIREVVMAADKIPKPKLHKIYQETALQFHRIGLTAYAVKWLMCALRELEQIPEKEQKGFKIEYVRTLATICHLEVDFQEYANKHNLDLQLQVDARLKSSSPGVPCVKRPESKDGSPPGWPVLKNTKKKDTSESSSKEDFWEWLARDEEDEEDEFVVAWQAGSKTIDGGGSKLVAQKKAELGDVIGGQLPLVSCLAREHFGSYCNNCFCLNKEHSRMFFCPTCSWVIYCSRKCGDTDWPLHRHLCKVLPYLMTEEKVWGPLIVMALSAILMQDFTFWDMGISDGMCRMPDYLEVLTEGTLKTRDENFQHAVGFVAVKTMQIFSQTEIWQSWVTTMKLPKVTFRFIACTAQVIIANLLTKLTTITTLTAIPDAEQQPAGYRQHELKVIPIGSGYYSKLCNTTHSCDPNCVVNFYGKFAFMQAIQSIEPNQEITICRTIPPWAESTDNWTTAAKLQKVRLGHLCTCLHCSDNLLATNEQEPIKMTLLCENCGTPVADTTELNRTNVCTKCSTSVLGRFLELCRRLDTFSDQLCRFAGISGMEKDVRAMHPLFDPQGNIDLLKFLESAVQAPSGILRHFRGVVSMVMAHRALQRGFDADNFGVFWARSTAIPSPTPRVFMTMLKPVTEDEFATAFGDDKDSKNKDVIKEAYEANEETFRTFGISYADICELIEGKVIAKKSEEGDLKEGEKLTILKERNKQEESALNEKLKRYNDLCDKTSKKLNEVLRTEALPTAKKTKEDRRKSKSAGKGKGKN